MQEQMEQFIQGKLQNRMNEGSLSATTVKKLFQHALDYEDKFGKEAADFSVNEILEMLRAKESRSVGTLQNYMVILKQYADPINPMNDYQRISKEMIEKCVAQDKVTLSIITREELDDIQSKMLNAVDKAIMECLFMGVGGKNMEDLTNVRQNQLNNGTGILTVASGKQFLLTQRQFDMLQAAFDEEVMTSYGVEKQSFPVDEKGRLYKRKPNAYTKENADRRFRWLQRQFAIWCEEFNRPHLTMKSVATSGLIHELQKGMRKFDGTLRNYLRTNEGRELAERYGYTNDHYVDIIANKVKGFIPR